MEGFTTLNSHKCIIKINEKITEYDIFAGRILSLYITLNVFNVAISLFLPETLLDKFFIIISAAVFWGYLLLNFGCLIKTIEKALPYYLLAIIVMLLGIVAGNSEVKGILLRFIYLFLWGIPLLAIMSKVQKTQCVIDNSFICVPFTSAISFLTLTLGIVNGGIKGDYSMSLGYALLYPTLLLLYKSLEKKRFIDIFLFLVNVFVIVSYGSRGQILCIGIFFIIHIIVGNGKVTPKRMFTFFTLILIGVTVLVNLEGLLKLLISILGQFGIYSRSLGYFLERAHYTGREVVWASALSRINERPLLGWTVGVDTSMEGFYPHNLFLEFLLHYGILIGGICSLYIVITVLLNVFIYKEHDKLTLITFCYGFIPLMLTSEYLLWPSFWAFLGLCIGRNRRKNYENRRCYNDI